MDNDLISKVCELANARISDQAVLLVRQLRQHLLVNPDDIARADFTGLLSSLRSRRHFEAMCELAETALMLGVNNANVRRQYGQALIETGKPVAAIEVLRPLTRSSTRDNSERIEALGLTGRAYKDLYVNGRLGNTRLGRSTIRAAVDSYRAACSEQQTIWHGINLATLLFRAEKDGADPGTSEKSGMIARAVRDQIMAKPDQERDAWDWATLAEASAILSDWEQARSALAQYTSSKDTDVFRYAGTLRQLEDVLQIETLDPAGTEIVGVLKGAMIRLGDGKVDLARQDLTQAASASKDSYERILGTRGAVTHRWIENMIDRGKRVGQIRRRIDDQGFGTCFAIRGGDLGLEGELASELLLLTNEHVVTATSDLNHDGSSLLDDAIDIRFELLSQGDSNTSGRPVTVKDVLWCSTRNDHDASLLRVSGLPEGLEGLPLAPRPPVLSPDDPQWVYVIGHPGGRSLSYSIQESKLLDYEDHDDSDSEDPLPKRIHYTSPTEPGSSGSPVFNEAWKVVALHHAGAEYMPKLNGQPGTQPANQGILISSIRRAIGLQGITDRTSRAIWRRK